MKKFIVLFFLIGSSLAASDFTEQQKQEYCPFFDLATFTLILDHYQAKSKSGTSTLKLDSVTIYRNDGSRNLSANLASNSKMIEYKILPGSKFLKNKYVKYEKKILVTGKNYRKWISTYTFSFGPTSPSGNETKIVRIPCPTNASKCQFNRHLAYEDTVSSILYFPLNGITIKEIK